MYKFCAFWCDGGGGSERVNALRCARPISALRRSPSPPPPASSGPSTGNRDPGLFVILAQHTPPGSSPALPWSSRWLLRRVLVYLRAIRGHCSPKTGFPFRVVNPSGDNEQKAPGVSKHGRTRCLLAALLFHAAFRWERCWAPCRKARVVHVCVLCVRASRSAKKFCVKAQWRNVPMEAAGTIAVNVSGEPLRDPHWVVSFHRHSNWQLLL